MNPVGVAAADHARIGFKLYFGNAPATAAFGARPVWRCGQAKLAGRIVTHYDAA
jgi:hypothetical protein